MAAINPPLVTISSLKFIKAADLATSLRQSQTASKVAIIDVRDNDHIGGNIKGSQWVPADQVDYRIPELLRLNKDKERVVFHCMLSQQRGPSAALKYARAKAYAEEKARIESGKEASDSGVVSNGTVGTQQVCVLEGGFESWARFYGEDKDLTDAFEKDLWD